MTRWFSIPAAPHLGLLLSALSVCAGCHQDMRDQPRYEGLEPSVFFADGKSARHPVPGTVARGYLDADDPFRTGRDGTQLLTKIPGEVDRAMLERGRERFNIFCAVCHARSGEGDGMIVLRGFKRPPSLHEDRLRQAPAGHFFDVITNGIGVMPHYRVQIAPEDRWAIVAYIRALQWSQNAGLEDVPERERAQLEGQP